MDLIIKKAKTLQVLKILISLKIILSLLVTETKLTI
jgi:hypothetical protein